MPQKHIKTGRPPGRPKGALGKNASKNMMTDALTLALMRYADEAFEDGTKKKQLNLIADALVKKAIDGDVGAIEVVFERIDGRVKQAIEATLKMPLLIHVPREEDNCLTINGDTPRLVH